MPAKAAFDRRVLERYANLEAQRRSYPEMPALLESFDERQYRYHIQRSNAGLIPRPLSLHLHVPEIPCRAEHYVEQLLREIELTAPLFDQDRDVARVQLGGSADRLDPDLSDQVLASIDRRFHITDSAVFGYRIDLDASDVDTRRFSVSHAGRTYGVDVQITFGLMPQSMDGFADAIRAVILARPDSIDLVDGALTLQDDPAVSGLDAVTRLSMLERAVDLLTDAGYSHTCKGRFNLADPGIDEFDCDRIGLGPGAISNVGDGVAENISGLREWQSALDARHLPVARGATLAAADRHRAVLIRSLLRSAEVDAAITGELDCISPGAADSLRQLEACGLVRIDKNGIVITSSGRYLWRILAKCFDPDLQLPGRAARRDGHHAEERRRRETAQ